MDALIIVTFALLNRMRGGGIITGLPGNGRNYVVPFVVILAWLVGAHSIFASRWDPVLYAACWFAWCLPPWGNWITLDFEVYVNTYKGFTKFFVDVIDRAASGNPYLALGLRMFIGLIPVAVLFSPLYLTLAPVMVGCYLAGWLVRAHLFPKIDAIAIGELLTGGLTWGVVLTLLR